MSVASVDFPALIEQIRRELNVAIHDGKRRSHDEDTIPTSHISKDTEKTIAVLSDTANKVVYPPEDGTAAGTLANRNN